MVEINLFEDEEGQPAKHDKSGDSPSRKDDDLTGDSLKSDDFSFDDELTEPSLDQFDSDVEPDFKDDAPLSGKGKRSKGSGGSKKASPVIWGLLALTVVAVAGYLFILKPAPAKGKRKPGPTVRPIPTAAKTPADTAVTPGFQQGTTAAPAGIPSSGPTAKYVASAKAVAENLGKDGQFVALLFKGDQYFIEYAAAARGGAEAMGKRIQGLLGADAFKASPEDRHKIGGNDRYFAVISGNLPIAKNTAGGAGSKIDAEAFKARLNALVTEKGMTNTKIQKVTETTLNGKLQTPIRIRTEGSRSSAIAFLDALKSLPANGEMSKLLMVPVELTDLHADRVKLVLDFAVE
jgi:hypothetical protein